MTIRYYQDNLNGDFIAVNHFKASQNADGTLPTMAPTVPGKPATMGVTSLSKGYIRDNCTPILKMRIPDEWYTHINLNQNPLTI